MKNLFILFALATSTFTFAQESVTWGDTESINWMSIEEAEAAAKKEPRKIIIDVYTDWCGWCKKMDKDTFQNEKIAVYINAKYYAVKLNAEQKDSIVFQGHTFKFVAQGKRGYHELAAALLNGKMSYPNIVYLDEEFKMIQPIPGYMAPAQFEEVIKFIGSDSYKTTPFDEYQKSFKSEL